MATKTKSYASTAHVQTEAKSAVLRQQENNFGGSRNIAGGKRNIAGGKCNTADFSSVEKLSRKRIVSFWRSFSMRSNGTHKL